MRGRIAPGGPTEVEMKIGCRVIGIMVLLVAATLAAGQSDASLRDASGPDLLSCSPAPCVLPPTQASEGGAEVTDTPIVADPLNPLHLLLGSTDFNCLFPSLSGFHISSDGGSTWSVYCMPIIQDFQGHVFWPGGEPGVGYDLNGTAYIAGDYGDSEGLGYGLVAVQKSTDGVNWSQPAVALSGGYSAVLDGWMAVDTSASSPYVNSLYVTAGLVGDQSGSEELIVSHSHDGGATWHQTDVAGIQRTPAGDVYPNLTVDNKGELYLAWMYCDSGPFYFCSNNKGNMVFSKSTDGGNTWTTPTLMATIVLGLGIPNTNVGDEDYPAIAVDNSDGPYAGNLYVVMYTWTGIYMRVQVIRSTDGGNTWSKPVPVAPGITHDQFFPWISVSPTGLVGVSWLDRRNDPNNVNYQAFAAISSDGGRSFQPNVQLTTKFSNPNNNGGPDDRWMGDYSGNTWDGPDYFIAAWMDSSNGVDMQEEVGGIRLK